MKKITFIILLLTNFNLFAQNTYVPDDNFERALIYYGFDSGTLNDSVPTANINGVKGLNLIRMNIKDLTGIANFTALLSLACGDNQLTSLDLSANTSLTYLNCYTNQLTSLNVSKNIALTDLFCGNNKLTNLDISANTDLKHIDCSTNQLTSLDVSANAVLTELDCFENQLTKLDVSKNKELLKLNCSSNQIICLDVSKTNLISLDCSSNQLTKLDVRNKNNANFRNFNAINNPNLLWIYVDDKTATPYCFDRGISRTSIFVNNADECRLTYVPDDNFEQNLIDDGYDHGALDDSVPTININEITILQISNENISDLTGIEDFAALEILVCSSNQLTNLDVSANELLSALECNNNQLTSLDVSKNTALTKLFCTSNQLTKLDVRNGENIKLISFYTTNNPNLHCIYVDDKTVTNAKWKKDEITNYVNNENECDK